MPGLKIDAVIGISINTSADAYRTYLTIGIVHAYHWVPKAEK